MNQQPSLSAKLAFILISTTELTVAKNSQNGYKNANYSQLIDAKMTNIKCVTGVSLFLLHL